MTRNVRFHPLATAEVVEAQLWYENRVDGLGSRFLGAVRATTERAARWPNAGPPTRQDDSGEQLERKIALAGFPYVVVYRVASEDVAFLPYITNAVARSTGLTASPTDARITTGRDRRPPHRCASFTAAGGI